VRHGIAGTVVRLVAVVYAFVVAICVSTARVGKAGRLLRRAPLAIRGGEETETTTLAVIRANIVIHAHIFTVFGC
jgi:hypothetical protein